MKKLYVYTYAAPKYMRGKIYAAEKMPNNTKDTTYVPLGHTRIDVDLPPSEVLDAAVLDNDPEERRFVEMIAGLDKTNKYDWMGREFIEDAAKLARTILKERYDA